MRLQRSFNKNSDDAEPVAVAIGSGKRKNNMAAMGSDGTSISGRSTMSGRYSGGSGGTF